MKKEIAIGICFALAGVLCASLFGYEYFATYGFLNRYHMLSFAEAQMDTKILLESILWERGKLLVLLWILSYTPFRKVMPLVLECLVCFTGGVFLAACVLHMGMGGIFFCIVSWIPHGAIYLLVLIMMMRSDTQRYYRYDHSILKRIAAAGMLLLLFLLGCVTEATTGVWILGKTIPLLLGT